MELLQHEYEIGRAGNRGGPGILGPRRPLTAVTRQAVPNTSMMKTERIRDGHVDMDRKIWPFDLPPKASVLRGMSVMQRYGGDAPRMTTEIAPYHLHKMGVHHITPMNTRGFLGAKKSAEQTKIYARPPPPVNALAIAGRYPVLGEQTAISKRLTTEMVNMEDRTAPYTKAGLVDNIFVPKDSAKAQLRAAFLPS